MSVLESLPNGAKYSDRIFLVQDSKLWLDLANSWTQNIEKNYFKNSKNYIKNSEGYNNDIILRLIANKDGELIAYFAYDDQSRQLIYFTMPFILKALHKKTIDTLISDLANGGKIEFVDFKIVLSQDGKVKHILPWSMAYPNFGKYLTTSGINEELYKNIILNPLVESVFQHYTPDLSNPSELSILNAILTINLSFIGFLPDKGLFYEEPAIFKIKVSADGQIVEYEAINQVAIQKFDKKLPFYNFKTPQFPELVKSTYAYFKMEIKGLGNYKFTPWSDYK